MPVVSNDKAFAWGVLVGIALTGFFALFVPFTGWWP